jgi:hypothetical protein
VEDEAVEVVAKREAMGKVSCSHDVACPYIYNLERSEAEAQCSTTGHCPA